MAKKKKRMGNIYGIVFLIISVFLIYTLIAKVQHIKTEEATYQKLVVQENELKKEKAKLSKEVDSLNDSDYVVRYARSHYIFSKNGEEVIILPENK
ncbi:septum formation initiator family protein [uncultured Catenibacterium sp.]|uniref:FtsB family cell division protein n=1 Tax=uncultured Catenibacterium sp. TaxID=286142 RepID=UPI002596F397|nr:septum formation initiator family protein [uncultured Catenibacterium sp.]